MAFFNNENFLTCTIPAVEGAQYDPDNGGAANIAMEAYEDMLNVVKAIHAADMAELACKHQYQGMTESYVAEQIQVVQEKSVKEIFETIKDGIKKFFGKIATFFKKLYEKFFVFSKSNKSFAEKYTPILKNLKYDAKVKIQGYAYTNEIQKILDLVERGVTGVENDLLKPMANAVSDNLDRLKNDEKPDSKFYGMSSYEGTDDISAEQTAEILERHFDIKVTASAISGGSVSSAILRGMRGADKTSEISYNKDTLVSELEKLAKLDVGVLKKIESKMTSEFNKILKIVDKAQKTYEALPSDTKNKNECVQIVRMYNRNVTANKSICLATVSAFRTVASEYSNQIKRATVDLIGENKRIKKESEKKTK